MVITTNLGYLGSYFLKKNITPHKKIAYQKQTFFNDNNNKN